ncbi:MAG: hypothetical protein V4676_09425 [Bacteroidota bacterium]
MKFPVFRFMVLAFSAMSAIDPQQQTTSGKPVYFYPAGNIYFDTGNALYTVFDEEQGWKQTENISDEIKPALGNKAIILKPSTPVWAENAADRMYYSAALFASSGEIAAKYRADEVAFTPKNTVVSAVKTTEPAKTKTGIGRFFKKIFGKKES